MGEKFKIPEHIDLERVKALTEREISHLTIAARDAVLDIMRGGKYLRPTFLLLASETKDKIPDEAYGAAAGLELIHLASLIHDDIIDRSSTRRGMPCLHKTVGVKQALPVGDFLYARGFRLIFEKTNPQTLPSILNAAEGICLGELRQNEMIGKNVLKAKYIENIRSKTGILFAEALTCGDSFIEPELQTSKLLHDAGLAFGIYYQIMDDVKDLKGESNGKDLRSDARNGIYTLPLLYSEISTIWLRILPGFILSRLATKSGGFGKAINKAMSYKEESLGYLDKIIEKMPERTGITKLKDLINSI
ncbi:MAG: polyprenyl synthetase family protein [Spirochaetales bacterium]|nr:polyprenyl synthetase family protein [Spirochaetales bacterium]